MFNQVIRESDKYKVEDGNYKSKAYHELSRIAYFQSNFQSSLQFINLALDSYIDDERDREHWYIVQLSKVIYLDLLGRNSEALQLINEIERNKENVEKP